MYIGTVVQLYAIVCFIWTGFGDVGTKIAFPALLWLVGYTTVCAVIQAVMN